MNKKLYIGTRREVCVNTTVVYIEPLNCLAKSRKSFYGHIETKKIMLLEANFLI